MRKDTRLTFSLALLLFRNAKRREIFVIQEEYTKPERAKEMGMLSTPLVEIEWRDPTAETALNRLLRKEVGISRKQVKIFDVGSVLTPVREKPEHKVLYSVGEFHGSPWHWFEPNDHGVQVVGWMSWDEWLSQPTYKVRVGARAVISDYLRISTTSLRGSRLSP